MRKKTFIILTVIFAAINIAWTGSESQFRKVPNTTFQSGEYIKYRVHYGWITAGNAIMRIEDEPSFINDRECFHVVAEGISHKSFDWFFKVRDKYETFIDKESLFSWRFKRKIQEGKFREYTEVNFDQVKHKAYEKKNKWLPVEYDVPENIQDVLSAFYFARTRNYDNMKPGDKVNFRNFIDQKVFDLDVEFIGREEIKVEGVKYNTVKLKPLVQEGGIFKHKGDLFLWISDDENRIPVRVESAVVIGSVKVDLVETSGLKHPFTAKLND